MRQKVSAGKSIAITAAATALLTLSCAAGPGAGQRPTDAARTQRGAEPVRPGLTVLLEDSLHLIAGKRVGLLTNQTGLDERGTSGIDLLSSDPRVRAAGVQLVALYSPEHGIRGTEDRTNLASGVDERTGLVIHSLYTVTTIGPPDSTLAGVEALVFDLQDIGTRTWTYVGLMIYSLRSAQRAGVPILVLDRPNPIGGVRREGPLLDSAIANPEDHTPTRQGRAYALWPFPLRHGMTMGEMALFYNETLGIGAKLHVVPMAGWRRSMWYDETGLPWVRPSPNMPSILSALIYPALVGFEASNLSVGRGTAEAFQRFGAPWLKAAETAELLNDRELPGIRFEAEHFTPQEPGDRKFGGVRIPGVRIIVEDRDRVNVGRVGAAILWAVARTSGDSLRINPLTYDLRFGSPAAREALMRGVDPDTVIDATLPSVVAFEQNARRFLIYR
jgi:uncharacterized protein YbbC (DUF1343 family)